MIGYVCDFLSDQGRGPVARPVVNGFDSIPESESRTVKSPGNTSMYIGITV